jgi:hypothetical protein
MTIFTQSVNTRVKRLVMLAVAAPAALMAAPALATPHDGLLASPSVGDITITASVAARARITNLSDVTFTNQDPNTAAASNQNVCVWSNTTTKGYKVTASGDGTGSAFTLTNGTGNVPYSVEWAGSTGQSTGTALTATTASTTFTSTAVNQTCSSAPLSTASLIVKIGTTDLGTMTSGGSSYTGVLTLSIAPQ